MNLVSFGAEKQFSYDPDSNVGKGTYGAVYECFPNDRSVQLKQKLCVKITTCQNDIDKKYQERERQINLIIQNSSENKNLVKVHYVYFDQNKSKLYVVMDRQQTNLQNLIDEKKKFTYNETLDFMQQFLNGYSVLFKNKVVHRDIKPENILVDKINQSYIYKLTDFGVGKIYKQNDFSFTKAGTKLYAAPECNQATNDEELSRQFSLIKEKKNVVDIFSLGIVIYQLVHGSLPYKKTTFDGIKQFFNSIKQSKLTLNIFSFDQRLTDLIERMLIYNPQQRLSFDDLYRYFKMESLLLEGSEVNQPKANNFQQLEVKFQNQQGNFFSNTMNNRNQNFPNWQAPAQSPFGNANPQINNQQGFQFAPQGEQKNINNFQQLVTQPQPMKQQPNFNYQAANNFAADRMTNKKQFPTPNPFNQSSSPLIKQQENVVNQFQQTIGNQRITASNQVPYNIKKNQYIQNILGYLKRELQINRKILSQEVISILEIIDVNNWNQYSSKIQSWFQFEQSCEQIYSEKEIFFLFQLFSLKNEKIYLENLEKSSCLAILKSQNKIN